MDPYSRLPTPPCWHPSEIVNGPPSSLSPININKDLKIASDSDNQQAIQPESVRIDRMDDRRRTCSLPDRFPYQPNIQIDDLLRALALKYEIQHTLAERLRLLKDFEIVILCDDSGSMITHVDGTERTRWDELRSITKIVLEIGTIFDSNGVDIFFLNRRTFLNITDPRDVDQAFAAPPSGFTPLATALRSIFQLPAAQRGNDKKLLVFVATDGAPTDERGNPNLPDLERVMREERQVDTTHVMFLPCTDDLACVSYLDQWDRTMINVDVTDDFRTEREKIRRFRGPNYPFSLGDYIVKTLIGAVDEEIDALNDPDEVDNSGEHESIG